MFKQGGVIITEIKAVSVSQINAYIKKIIDSNGVLSNFWIRGEISNYKRHYSGHLYVTLKDENSVLKAVMFKGNAMSLNFEPKDGQLVLARGRLSVYEPTGSYQFYIEEMIESGKGDLQAKFEELKKRLEAEGLFEPSHKKKIPAYPNVIGVCTATTGAAVRDIINVTTRRFPACEIIIYPTIVQGEASAQSIVDAIKWFNDNNAADVLIVGRGGGSIEDLWSFNEESVAYAIFQSQIPIISAVGHETDFTISDFVSDLRAPTPSAAAELAVPSAADVYLSLKDSKARIIKSVREKIEYLKLKTDSLTPPSPSERINQSRLKLDLLSKSLYHNNEACIQKAENDFRNLVGALNSLSPLSVLSRGYSIAMNAEQKSYKSVTELKSGDDFILKMNDGELGCTVL